MLATYREHFLHFAILGIVFFHLPLDAQAPWSPVAIFGTLSDSSSLTGVYTMESDSNVSVISLMWSFTEPPSFSFSVMSFFQSCCLFAHVLRWNCPCSSYHTLHGSSLSPIREGSIVKSIRARAFPLLVMNFCLPLHFWEQSQLCSLCPSNPPWWEPCMRHWNCTS